jgi:hypothetical protein
MTKHKVFSNFWFISHSRYLLCSSQILFLRVLFFWKKGFSNKMVALNRVIATTSQELQSMFLNRKALI